jgi:hypothetical protein
MPFRTNGRQYQQLGLRLMLTVLACSVASRAAAVVTNFTPTTTNTYQWNTAGNWSAGVPNAVADSATFLAPVDSAVRTVNLSNNVTLGTLTFTNDTSNNPQNTILSSDDGSKLILQQTATGGQPTLTSDRPGAASGQALDQGNEIAVPLQLGLDDGVSGHATQLFLNVGFRRDSKIGLSLSGGVIGDKNSAILLNNGGANGTNGHGFANVSIADSPNFQGTINDTAGGIRVTGNNLANAGSVSIGFGGQFQIDSTVSTVNLGSNATLSLSGPGKISSDGATLRGYGPSGALRYESTSGSTTFNSPVDINGGALYTSNTGAGATVFVNTGGTLNFGQEVTGANTSGAANRTLTKEGAGTLILGNDTGNYYEGGTWVRTGSVLIDNATGDSATGRRFVTVEPGATLGGTGTINTNQALTNNVEPFTTITSMTPNGTQAVTIKGNLSPGMPDGNPLTMDIGKMSITTNLLAFASGSTLTAEMLSPTAFDKVMLVNSTANVTIASNVTLNFTIDPSFSGGTVGDFYALIDKAGSSPISGTFANIAEGQTLVVGNDTFQWMYDGGTGNDFGLKLTAVPEPATLSLALLGGLGMLLGYRRRQRGARSSSV